MSNAWIDQLKPLTVISLSEFIDAETDHTDRRLADRLAEDCGIDRVLYAIVAQVTPSDDGYTDLKLIVTGTTDDGETVSETIDASLPSAERATILIGKH